MDKKIKIAQLGTVWETTPPKLYGGTERVVSLLTEELVSRGHEVTLFATGDSKTKAKLVSVVPNAIYRMKLPWYNLTYPLMNIYEAYHQAKKFDILHMHLNIVSDFAALALSDLLQIPTVFTLHFNLPTKDSSPDRFKFMEKFANSNYISISNSQRTMKNLNYVSTVYNGIDVESYDFNPLGGNNLFWLGRYTVEKGAGEAIEVAIGCKKEICMAGKLDIQDKKGQEYYDVEIKPRMKTAGKLVNCIGEIDDQGKNHYLGKSKCLINPINWREPFGLVVAEANACGTPVVAFANGSMPEIIKEGVNGFLIKPGDVKSMTKTVQMIYEMPADKYAKLRESSREYAENNFSKKIMADNYEKVYKKILEK